MVTKCPLERVEARKLKQWADYHPIAKHYLAPIPNGGSRNKLEAINMKRDGQVRAGVSDYFLAYPVMTLVPKIDNTDDFMSDKAGTWPMEIMDFRAGLWIELKRKDQKVSKPTAEQLEWLERMRGVKYDAVVAYGADEAIKAIEEYLR